MNKRPFSRAMGGPQGRRPGFSPANLSVPNTLRSQPRPNLGGGDPTEGVGASSYAPYPAPAGFQWLFVTDNGVPVNDNGVPVVSLERIA